MGCQVIINSWTFPKLVGAFLDLLITLCLLCCSTFAFFLCKFLAFFGFTLPCLCNSGPCLQRLLVDCSTKLNLKVLRDRRTSIQLEPKGGPANQSQRSSNRRRRRRHHISSASYAIRPSPWRAVQDSESYDATDESELMYENATSFHYLKNVLGSGHVANGVGENAVKILELALEEEQVACHALWSELEQERLAAATAADEAMAMISRLQEEKSSIEIEARQFQRILEEKSAYDAEEMDILKEIIVRRELEKHYLEKEVEAYRKIFKARSGSQSNDTQEQIDNSFLDFSVDPMLILQQISESIDKRISVGNLNNYPDFTSVDVHKRTCTVSESKESSILRWDHKTKTINELESQCPSIIPDNVQSDDEVSQDIQEKGVLSLNEVTYPHLCETSSPQGHNNIYLQQNTMFDALKSDYREPHVSHVHDVHIIDPSSSSRKNKDVTEGDQMPIKCEFLFSASNCRKDDGFADNCLKVESKINRSFSDTMERFPRATSSPDRSFVSEIDNERLRIGNQNGWLRERLRAVQEEKKRLKSSMEIRELQLKDVASQLQEQSARHTSLPPLPSKVMSKKRRSQSAPLGVGRSESS